VAKDIDAIHAGVGTSGDPEPCYKNPVEVYGPFGNPIVLRIFFGFIYRKKLLLPDASSVSLAESRTNRKHSQSIFKSKIEIISGRIRNETRSDKRNKTRS
jgi:hypothetical protein